MTALNHPNEEILELFSMDRLEEISEQGFTREQVSEHLAACAACRENLTEIREFVLALRNAFRDQASVKKMTA